MQEWVTLISIIAKRPDITLAVFRLSKLNQQPRSLYHKVADQIFNYLFLTKNYHIHYKREIPEFSSFI